MVEASRKRINQRVYIGAAFILLFGGFMYYWFDFRFAVCDVTQTEWCRACIKEGGSWEIEGNEPDLYCQGATFSSLEPDADFVAIHPGSFVREDGAKVEITKDFQMGRTEVTQGQWYAVMGNNPSSKKGPNLPVEQVSWDDVQSFLVELNSQSKDYTYRLPSEAEWEYACRAGTTNPYGIAEKDGDLDDYAWYGENSKRETQPVATKAPNGFELYDMSGNVWEWVQDYYSLYDSLSVINPKGPQEGGDDRVLRGGSFGDRNNFVRCAYRYRSFRATTSAAHWISC